MAVALLLFLLPLSPTKWERGLGGEGKPAWMGDKLPGRFRLQ